MATPDAPELVPIRPEVEGRIAADGARSAQTDHRPRCRHCGKILAYFVSRPWRIRCPRCGVTTGE